MLATEETPTPRLCPSDKAACLRRQLDVRLAEILGGHEPGAAKGGVLTAMRYVALADGKRIRPLALLVLAEALDYPAERLLDVACAIELIHTASLVLDDLPCMDDAHMRRSKPAVHIEFGEDVAVLVAVALLGNAWELVAQSTLIGAPQQVQIIAILSRSVGVRGLVQGQFRDIREGRAARPLAEVMSTNDQKTGALFSAVFEIAACVAAVKPERQQHLLEAACELGRAFQLRDDLHDCESSPRQTGKDSGLDAGKSTCVNLMGRHSARELVETHLARAERAVHKVLPDDMRLMSLFRDWIQPSAAR